VLVQNKLTEEADLRQIQEESDVVVKVGEHMQVSFSSLLLTSAVVISIITLRHGD